MIKTKNLDEDLIGRPDLAQRWRCHPETIKRREREGLLHPFYLSSRMVRYSMAEVLALEAAAQQRPGADTHIPGRFVSTTSALTPVSAPTTTAAPGSRRRQRGVPMKKGHNSKPKGVPVELKDTDLE